MSCSRARAACRNDSRLLLTVGEQILARQGKNVPDGSIIGGRGRHGMLASDNAINTWFLEAYKKEFNAIPNFPAYHMLSSTCSA